MITMVDLKNSVFGSLTVIRKNGNSKKGYANWLCLCDCGKEATVRSDHLKSGNTKSCGCGVKKGLLKANTTHGLSSTKLYGAWRGMKQRCYYTKHDSYSNYGARGVTVCDEWRNSFKAYSDWALSNGYKEGLQIDRIDNYKGYSPENCRWVTQKENNKNKR